jgi:hypothetical protein
MPERKPPRYVPTLTEVVGPAGQPKTAADAATMRDEIVERVMQRVDLTLERRLREAIAATVLEQTSSIVPLLRQEIESVVRETVAEAFEQESRGRRP